MHNLGTNWTTLEVSIDHWLKNFKDHPKHEIMAEFKNGGFDRKGFNLKELRNVIVGLTPSSKPWEIAVGQVIGKIGTDEIPKNFNEHKICNYLGNKLADRIRA